jgi:RNA polymerase sigma-70 factor (ECF subfamily)
MPAVDEARESKPGTQDRVRFNTTRWTLVLAAGRAPTAQSRRALAQLCEIYWYPLYAFVRRQGQDANDALDLTQGFFARLLEKNDIASADRQRGRFRSWLLAAMKHFMANEWHKQRAQKRGGGKPVLSFDVDLGDAEDRYRMEPSHELTAEKIFDRRWALTLLGQVLGQLQREMESEGKGKQFEKLKQFLTGDRGDQPYKAVGKELSMSEGAVKVAVHRLRKRYRDLLRQEIAETVEGEEQVEEEISSLFAALA